MIIYGLVHGIVGRAKQRLSNTLSRILYGDEQIIFSPRCISGNKKGESEDSSFLALLYGLTLSPISSRGIVYASSLPLHDVQEHLFQMSNSAFVLLSPYQGFSSPMHNLLRVYRAYNLNNTHRVLSYLGYNQSRVLISRIWNKVSWQYYTPFSPLSEVRRITS